MAGPVTGLLPLRLQDIGLTLDGRELLRDIDLCFDEGGISILLGHNGAGKTLLLKLCHGLLRPTAGRLVWNEPDAALRPGAQAMVFQKPVLLRRSVARNIHHVLKAGGVARAERSRRVEQALELGGLTGMARRPARQLSGGEQQRVALARAWAVRPELLILDEPCTYLDPGAVREVEDIIHAFRQSGTKIIMATHDLAQARRLAADIVVLHRGSVAESGEAPAFFAGPSSDAARAFLEGRLWRPDTGDPARN